MAKKFSVTVNASQCFNCGICEDVCPRDVWKLKAADFVGIEGGEIKDWMGTYAEVTDEDKCIGCLFCVNQCPLEIIEVKLKEHTEG